ncbi:MAG: hypothetical protein MUP55_04475 [Candidatus Aenigmarchaeota archaeon]|nr:hypothetical protein [Candidatus Aenigmarchaeota archaeon]
MLPVILLLVISVSGCTGFESIPFIGSFCIPGLTCAQVVEYENDVLVIKTLDAVPQTISTGQQLRLSAWIENRGGETLPQKYFKENFQGYYAEDIRIELYDTCEGLFEKIEVTCPPDATPTDKNKGCWIKTILPKQTIPISWILVANKQDKIPLETSCNLKVYIHYPYQTKSITSISFVDYTEMQRMIDEGKFKPITSYITEGFGPIKPYLTVEDTQPIPVRNGVDSTFAMAFQVKNKGSGFLSSLRCERDYQGECTGTGAKYMIKIANPDDIEITSNTPRYDIGSKVKDKVTSIGDIQLIGTESPKQPFSIDAPTKNQVEKIATYYVTTSIAYLYEFRKEIKVTIKPPKIF